jgi:hypothetical protein
LGLTPTDIDEANVKNILSSNPNFNYLYSNYSSKYDEPIVPLTIIGIPQEIINFLYGPDLDVG